MQLYQFLHQGKADARALMRCVLCPLDAMKPLEQARNFTRGNADAGIADGQGDLIAIAAQRHRDAAVDA